MRLIPDTKQALIETAAKNKPTRVKGIYSDLASLPFKKSG